MRFSQQHEHWWQTESRIWLTLFAVWGPSIYKHRLQAWQTSPQPLPKWSFIAARQGLNKRVPPNPKKPCKASGFGHCTHLEIFKGVNIRPLNQGGMGTSASKRNPLPVEVANKDHLSLNPETLAEKCGRCSFGDESLSVVLFRFFSLRFSALLSNCLLTCWETVVTVADCPCTVYELVTVVSHDVFVLSVFLVLCLLWWWRPVRGAIAAQEWLKIFNVWSFFNAGISSVHLNLA